MANLSITNTFSNNTTADASQVNTNFTDIQTWLNNRDNATASWLNLTVSGTADITTISHTGGTTIKGTNTNDSAASGNVGEYISSLVLVASSVTAGTTDQFKNITTISLTAGDWDVTGIVVANLAGATVTRVRGAVSAYTGNTTTDQNQGDNETDAIPPTAAYNSESIIPAWRVSISSTSTIYLKAAFAYSAGTPTMSGRISARRVR